MQESIDEFVAAFQLGIMWWPINQECIGCKHKCTLSEREYKTFAEELILNHGSKCAINTRPYERNNCEMREE